MAWLVFPINALNLLEKSYSGRELPTKSKMVQHSLFSVKRRPRPSCCKNMVKLSVGRKNNSVSNKFKIKFNKWEQWCKKNNLSRNVACINFIRNQKLIDYLILGFENSRELKDNISILKKKSIKVTSKFKSNNLKIIDPRQW